MRRGTGRRLLLVVSAPGGAAAPVLDALATLGVPNLVADPDATACGTVGTAGDRGAVGIDASAATDSATGSVAVDPGATRAVGIDAAGAPNAGDAPAPACAAWAPPPDLPWQRALPGAGWHRHVVLAWEEPERCVTEATSGNGRATTPAAAEAIASWEAGNRRLLLELAGSPVTVVAVAPDGEVDLAALRQAVTGPGDGRGADGAGGPTLAATRQPNGTAAPATATATGTEPATGTTESTEGAAGRADPSPLRTGSGDTPTATALPEHLQLAAVLRGLAGAHQVLTVPPLPHPSPWAAAVDALRSRLDGARRDAAEGWAQAATATADAEALWRALWWTGSQLAEVTAAALPAPPPPPGYGLDAMGDTGAYHRWLADTEPPPRPPGTAATDEPRLAGGPAVSVVVPVYKPDLDLLARCIGSVVAQSYGAWELCLCDDGSGDPDVTAALDAAVAADGRVRATRLERNGGISAATNAAIGLSSGAWVTFLDQDDELHPEALAAVAGCVLDHDDADVIYTDDDKLDLEGRRFNPQFKPDWNPDLLLSMAYFSHLVAVRRSLVDDLGGLRSEVDGSQDHDLALRATERARRVCHIPRILYHWRAIPGSAATDAAAKPWANEAGRRAVAEALARRGETGTVEHHVRRGFFHVRRDVVGDPLVSIVIPFRDGAGLLQRCLDSIDEDPGHRRYELVLVDNDSTEPELLGLLDRLSDRPDVTLVHDPRPFNWAALNNGAVERSSGDLLLLLNNDVTARSSGWLAAMVGHAQRPDVGAVGARLLYPDERVQHVGTVIGLGGVAGHVMAGLPGDAPGYMVFAELTRNWSAVTGACLMMRRAVYEEVGGLDETLAVSYNDVDLCLKVVEAGYRIVYTPLAELVHAESATRGLTGYGADIEPFVARWAHWLRDGDPLYNPNLSRLDARCVVRLPDEDDRWNERLRTLVPWWTS